MKLFARNHGKKTRGQTMVEFALVLPLLLFVMFGIMELGRLLFVFVTTTSAAREATRYASAVEETGGVSRFQDCIGIRAAARQVDVLNAIQTINIRYYVDYGGASTLIGACPNEGAVDQVGPDLDLGNQVVVEVLGNFQPIIPNLVPININQIEAESARTVIKDVPVGVLVPPIIDTMGVFPPWISFRSYYSFQPENCDGDPNCAGHTYNLPIKITDEYGVENVTVSHPITVEYWISGLSEARRGYDYTIAGYDNTLNRGEVVINDGAGTHIPIFIINDLLYEYYERVIIYLRSAEDTEGEIKNIVWPNVHLLYIIDDDRIPPVVQFQLAEDTVDETTSFGYKDIRVELDKLSGRDTIVNFSIVDYFSDEDPTNPLLPVPAIPGYDYLPPTSPLTIPAGTQFGYIRVPIFDDSLWEWERPETIKFTLDQPINAILGDPLTHNNRHSLTIVDNEVAEPLCNLSIAFNNNTASITNHGSIPIYITRVYVRWTASNRSLTSVRYDGTTIWSGTDASPDADLMFTPLNVNRRLNSETKPLVFGFSNPNANVNAFTIYFDNGCSVSYP